MARTLTGEILFNLTYDIEAIIPVEVGVTSMRREFFDEEGNDDQLKMNLVCLDEVRTKASQKMQGINRRWQVTTTKEWSSKDST